MWAEVGLLWSLHNNKYLIPTKTPQTTAEEVWQNRETQIRGVQDIIGCTALLGTSSTTSIYPCKILLHGYLSGNCSTKLLFSVQCLFLRLNSLSQNGLGWKGLERSSSSKTTIWEHHSISPRLQQKKTLIITWEAWPLSILQSFDISFLMF